MTGGVGRAIPDPGFAGDDGSADPAVAAALEAYRQGSSSVGAVLAALVTGRLLVPVVAVLDEAEAGPTGLHREKSSHMATVTVTGRDGRRALVAFTSTETLTRWRADARPVPVTASQAAGAALDEGADALVVDLAGPVPFAVEGAALRSLAAGHEIVRATDGTYAWAVPTASARNRAR